MRASRWLVAATVAALAAVTSGCGSRSGGQPAHAAFTWFTCVPFGCPVAENPMAAGGATGTITVSLANGQAFQSVRSSNPDVATFTIEGRWPNTASIVATSGVPGQTSLQLLDGGGALVDEVTVTVAPTAKLAFVKAWSGSAPLILEGTTQLFQVTTVDANDHRLVGVGAVAFELSPPLVTSTGGLVGDSVSFTGQDGAGDITAHCPDASLVQAITVVPLSAVTALSATAQPNTIDSGGRVHANVDVVASSGAVDGIYGAHCDWTVSDPLVVIENQTTAYELDVPPRSSAQFLLGAAGTFSATCAIGAVSTTVTLRR